MSSQLWLTQARRHAEQAGLVNLRYSVASGLAETTPIALAADEQWGPVIEKVLRDTS